jgi:hypothetical protein
MLHAVAFLQADPTQTNTCGFIMAALLLHLQVYLS